MEFAFSHRFDHSPAEVADAILDLDFQKSLTDLSMLRDREVLEQTEASDGRVLRRTRCVLGMDLPRAATSLLGRAEPAWVEEATWNPHSMRWTWTIDPEVGGDLLQANGSIELRDVANSTKRDVSGTLRIKVPIYGSKVESMVADGFQRSYDEEARRLRAWLKRGSRS